MNSIARRTFLKAVVAIPFAVWLERNGFAATSPVVRYDVLSTEGQAMLKIYADGVAKMKALFESDPLSWTFQWYTHAVRADRTKTTELNRIYPVPGPEKTLASTVWSTCQPHFNSANVPFFLPWHRLYVLRFEMIIRKLTNQPQFTLPYWNYSAAGPTHGILPAAFRVSSSSLFVQNRIASVNAGQPIDASSPGSLATTALSQCSYNPEGAVQGFCQALNSGLHGNVHVLIGDSKNMGSVPWAARDPIFWLHHCNIDRLWTSWNKAGRSNPNTTAFLDRTFTFADQNGQAVVGKVSDALSVLRLGYTYSTFESVPACQQPSTTTSTTSTTTLAESARDATRVLAAAAQVTLMAEPVHVQLKTAEALAAREPDTTFDRRIRQLPESTRVYLVISKLQAAAQPEVLYDLYIAPAEGATPKTSLRHRIGTINFFDFVSHGEEDHFLQTDDRFVSFDVTDLVRHLHLEKQLKAEPSVMIAPVGEPAANARPVIGSIELMLQP